jgi:cytochrome c oxidase subunit 2
VSWAQIQVLPEQASTFASRVDLLYFFMVAVTVFFTLLIALLVIAFAIRYRRRSADEKPKPIHGNNVLEITWTVIPLILVMIMFFWGAKLYFDMNHVPRDAMEILVTGKQWMWKLQHPNGKREINELHIPVNQPVKITMTSEDVIHSFYVPAFRIKQDAVPGKYTTAWFEATKVGKYHLFCAEYCGTEHARMGGWVYVMPEAEYQAWVGGQVADASPVSGGERLFASLGCATCHSGIKGAQGPDLAGVFGSEQKMADGEVVVADENYIRESILNPYKRITEGYAGVMPSYQGIVNEQQLLEIVAYIKSLADEGTADEQG